MGFFFQGGGGSGLGGSPLNPALCDPVGCFFAKIPQEKTNSVSKFIALQHKSDPCVRALGTTHARTQHNCQEIGVGVLWDALLQCSVRAYTFSSGRVVLRRVARIIGSYDKLVMF